MHANTFLSLDKRERERERVEHWWCYSGYTEDIIDESNARAVQLKCNAGYRFNQQKTIHISRPNFLDKQ